MKSEEWKTYRTRFLVNAKQLTSSLSFVDHLGRQHCGRKGDYLVESSDGVISIAARHIFEDIYVLMSHSTTANEASGTELSEAMLGTSQFGQPAIDLPKIDLMKFETFEMPKAQVKLRKSPARERRLAARSEQRNHIHRTMKLPSTETHPSPVAIAAARRSSFA
jgi:hypothetical protein